MLNCKHRYSEFKVGDKVEWYYPVFKYPSYEPDKSVTEYGTIEDIFIGEYEPYIGVEHMSIKVDSEPGKIGTQAIRINKQWMVYRGYHGYELPLRKSNTKEKKK